MALAQQKPRGRRRQRTPPLLLLVLLAAASAAVVKAFVLPSSPTSSMRRRSSKSIQRRHVTSGFPGQDGRDSSSGSNNNKQQHKQQHKQQQQQQQQAGAEAAAGAMAGACEEGEYVWRHNWRIHYVKAGVGEGKPPLLMCPGFGVGTEHFARNLGPLAETHQVFALDYLGQGRSWPEGDIEPHHGLVLSIETWMEEIVAFIEDVVKEPCFLAGNSLGGFLATAVAATRPDLVKGVVLWNATPFWSFAPNRRTLSDWAKRTIVPWDGSLPAPGPQFRIGAKWFDGLRDPTTVRTMLSAVYADDRAWDDGLVRAILRPTEHRHGHAAFTSILFAPKAPHTFEEYLAKVKAPILMLYGKEDPWVTPAWGQKAKRQRPDARYIEISPAGHCPHHEAPETVNALLTEWIAEVEEGTHQAAAGAAAGGAGGEGGQTTRVFKEAVTGGEIKATLQDGKPRDFMEWLVAATLLR